MMNGENKIKKIIYSVFIILLLSVSSALAYTDEEMDILKKKMELIKQTRRSRVIQPDNALVTDPREKVMLVAVTDACVKKMKRFPTREMIKDVCDYLTRSRVSAIGIDFVYDVPEVTDRSLVEFIERTPRVVLASDAAIDPNRLYKDWDEAGEDFAITAPYKALDKAVRKEGYINFDLTHGFVNLRFHSFLKRKSDIYLSMPLALVFIAENIEDFDVSLNPDQSVSKYRIKFGDGFEVPQKYVLNYRYNFKYVYFSELYAKAKKYLENPDPDTLPVRELEGKIALIGDMTADAKTYVKNNLQVYNIDLLGNSIIDIYERRMKTPARESFKIME
ncbi:MAG TPA: CHASE2 domain-containing protein [Candidatus Wallbacteria bacterium]|nr:CHASE2 domain-containing protein [Candidatus Wallbacteria bacterium]